MNIVEIIEKKRDNQKLSEAEITFFIDAYCKDEIAEYQASALLMAIYFQGLDDEELYYLTKAMIATGKTLDFRNEAGIFVDKHSTGGVGDKISLVLGPILAACGLKVAKMSGRGLSFTGGTLDKLESIPGYEVQISEQAFFEQVAKIGLSIIGQSADMVYADKKLYALRDVSGTVDSIPLIASSVMSKKIAAGSDIILLDVKYGDGAFMPTKEAAELLAKRMIAIGKQFGRKVRAEITSMNDVLGTTIGNALEVKEAIETLQGNYEASFYELCAHSAATLLMEAGVVDTEASAFAMVAKVMEDGSALEKLKQMIAYQHGDVAVIDDPELLVISKHQFSVISDTSGYLNQIKVKHLGMLACHLGAGRMRVEDGIDHSVGIVMHKKLGDKVAVGDILCTLYVQATQSDHVVSEARDCFQIETDKKDQEPLIYKVL